MSDLFNTLSEKMFSRLRPRFKAYEVRASLRQISARWNHILPEEEKAKVARTLGGNRYARTTRVLLDELFSELSEETCER